MQEASEVLGLEVSTVWQRSPLSRDAITRIISASVGPIEGEPHHVEGVYATLAWLADISLTIAINPRTTSRKEGLPLRKAFDQLMLAYPAALGGHAPPPAPSVEWMQQMLVWAGAFDSEATSTPGKPVNEFEHFVYPKLLAFYQLLSSAPPSATAGGPTYRFMRHFLDEMQEVLTAAVVSPPDAAARVKQAFTPPGDAALLMKIRTFRPAVADEVWLPAFVWEKLSGGARSAPEAPPLQ